MTMQPPVITACGKEVLYDDVHFADCATPHGAELIAAALNRVDQRQAIACYIEAEANKRRNPTLRRIMRVIGSNVRAGFDEVES